MIPGLPQVDLTPAVERYFEYMHRTIDVNQYIAVKWVQAAGTLSGVVREQAESVGDVVRERAVSVGEIVREKAATVEQAAHEQADRAEQAEKERAREARKAERKQARQAYKKARERYEGLTKAELSDLLAKRELPKTGNIDELIERLAEADSTATTLSGAVLDQVKSVGDVVREQADTVEQAAREQADRAEQAEKERAREARNAERKQARQAHEKARERYEGLTKAELSDLLAKRELPKTGNIDELIQRLVEADGK